jgi:transposase-like protein
LYLPSNATAQHYLDGRTGTGFIPTLRNRCRHRPVQYLNNILEQDHRAIKRRVNAKQGFREFQAARRTIQGYEAIHMIRKGQARWVAGDDLLRQIQFIDSLFDLAA